MECHIRQVGRGKIAAVQGLSQKWEAQESAKIGGAARAHCLVLVVGIFINFWHSKRSWLLRIQVDLGIGNTTANERGLALNDNGQSNEGRCKNAASDHVKNTLVVQLTEANSEQDSANHTRHGSSGLGLNVRNDTKGGSLSGLHEKGEEDHANNRSGETGTVGKDQSEHTLVTQKEGRVA
jgi:hypothetical protein